MKQFKLLVNIIYCSNSKWYWQTATLIKDLKCMLFRLVKDLVGPFAAGKWWATNLDQALGDFILLYFACVIVRFLLCLSADNKGHRTYIQKQHTWIIYEYVFKPLANCMRQSWTIMRINSSKSFELMHATACPRAFKHLPFLTVPKSCFIMDI